MERPIYAKRSAFKDKSKTHNVQNTGRMTSETSKIISYSIV